MNEQRARENSAYVRKLLSEREPEFAAALAAAERYISWSSRPGSDEDRDIDPYAAIPVRSMLYSVVKPSTLTNTRLEWLRSTRVGQEAEGQTVWARPSC